MKEGIGLFGDEENYWQRLRYELTRLRQKGLTQIFLLASQAVERIKEKGFLIGPGWRDTSGSLTAFALGLTHVDPLRHGLLFERFLRGFRSFPYLTLLLSEKGKEELKAHLLEENQMVYVPKIRGMLPAFVMEKLGHILGISLGKVEKLRKLIEEWDEEIFPERLSVGIDVLLKECPELKQFFENDHEVRACFYLIRSLEMLPRDFIPSNILVLTPYEKRPICPVFVSENDVYMSQFDSFALLKLGYPIIYLVGHELLSIVENSFANRGQFNPFEVPLYDPEFFKTLIRSDLVDFWDKDCESFVLSDYLFGEWLEVFSPRNVEELALAMVLYRKKPWEEGLGEEFFLARQGRRRKAIWPELREILKETEGVFLYEEQIMETAKKIGGYTPQEADDLRYDFHPIWGGIGPKRPTSNETCFVKRAEKRGVPRERAKQIFSEFERCRSSVFLKAQAISYATMLCWAVYAREFW